MNLKKIKVYTVKWNQLILWIMLSNTSTSLQLRGEYWMFTSAACLNAYMSASQIKKSFWSYKTVDGWN